MSFLPAVTSKPFLDYISAAIGAECLAHNYPPKETFGRENENYFLGLETKDGLIELVLRCEPREIRPSREGYHEDYISKEYYLLEELQNLPLGYRTPKVWGLMSGGLLETNYFLMERLEGSVLQWNFQPTYTEKLIRNYAEAVAALSNISLDFSATITRLLPEFPLAKTFSVTEVIAKRKYGNEKLMKYALDWLKEHFPRPRNKVISHGDLNPSNILTRNDSICGIIDWENAHISDESLVEVTHIGWIYDREDLIEIFCGEFGRSEEDLKWHLVRWFFANTFNQNEISSWEKYNRERLVRVLGYPG